MIFRASSGNARCNAFTSCHGAHPDIVFRFRPQDHRHRLRVDRLDHRIRGSRQEAIDEMRPGDRLRLGATVAPVLSPEPAEGELLRRCACPLASAKNIGFEKSADPESLYYLAGPAVLFDELLWF